MCSLAMPRDPPLPQPSAALWGGGGPGEGVGGHGLFTSKTGYGVAVIGRARRCRAGVVAAHHNPMLRAIDQRDGPTL